MKFTKEVSRFFDEHHIRYREREPLVGVSQATHTVDFALQNGDFHVVQAIASDSSMRRPLNLFYGLTERDPGLAPVAFVDEEKRGYSNAAFQQLSYKAHVTPMAAAR